MISKLHPRFRHDFARLPARIQRQARKAYAQFVADADHPGLEFKRLSSRQPLWSVRITDSYRAVGVRQQDRVTWFFIGTHAEYDKLLSQYR